MKNTSFVGFDDRIVFYNVQFGVSVFNGFVAISGGKHEFRYCFVVIVKKWLPLRVLLFPFPF